MRSGEPDLTNRQMALLMVVGQESALHTVRGLASRLGVSKPVVTRVLNALTDHGFVLRLPDPRDKRSILVELTDDGERFLTAFSRLLSHRDDRAGI